MEVVSNQPEINSKPVTPEELLKSAPEQKYPKVRRNSMLLEAFSMLIRKLANHPQPGKNAGHIRHIINEWQAARGVVIKEYWEGVKKFVELDEKGEIKRPEDDPEGLMIKEGQQEKLLAYQQEYDNSMVEIKWKPMTFETIGNMPITPQEIELLGELLTEAPQGPGIPDHVAQHLPGMNRATRRRNS